MGAKGRANKILERAAFAWRGVDPSALMHMEHALNPKP